VLQIEGQSAELVDTREKNQQVRDENRATALKLDILEKFVEFPSSFTSVGVVNWSDILTRGGAQIQANRVKQILMQLWSLVNPWAYAKEFTRVMGV